MEMNPIPLLNHTKTDYLSFRKLPAQKKKKSTVLGRWFGHFIYTAINEFYLGKYMSAYDVEISHKVAFLYYVEAT